MISEPVALPSRRSRLDSWKEIAAHLQRDVRTVQRWEKSEGLPVHRHIHGERGTVYAYTDELDQWWTQRGQQPKVEDAPLFTPRFDHVVGSSLRAIASTRWAWQTAVVVMVALAVAVLYWGLWSRRNVVIATVSTEVRARRAFALATTEGHVPRRITTPSPNGYLLVTGNGAKLYAVSSPDKHALTVVDVQRLQTLHTIDLPHAAGRPVLSANGKHLYIPAVSPAAEVMVVDTRTDQVVERIPADSPVYELAVTPDEKKLFVAMAFAGLKKVDLRTGHIQTLSAQLCPLYMTIDPAGKRIYVSYQCSGVGGWAGHNVVDIYDVDSEQSVGVIKDLAMVAGPLTLSPRGNFLFIDGQNACSEPAYDHVGCPAVPTHIMHLWDATNHRPMASIAREPNLGGNAAFVADSPRIVMAGGDLAVWDWSRRFIVERMTAPGAIFEHVALTPDGRRAFAVSAGSPDLWVFDSEPAECLPPMHGLANYFSGDGTFDDAQGVGSLKSTSPPEFVPGRIGQAFRFNGHDNFTQAVAGGDYCAYCSHEWTESLFMKFDSTAGEMTILERPPKDLARSRRLYKTRGNHLVLADGDGASIASDKLVEAGKWYHLATVTDEHHMSLYLDGVLQGTETLVRPFPGADARAPIFIGASPAKRNFLNGRIDELAVYNRALGPKEINGMASACTAIR